MDIRVLNRNDAEQYKQIRLTALRACPESFAQSFDNELSQPLSYFANKITPSNQSFIIGAFNGLTLVGTAGVSRQDYLKRSHKGMISGFYVNKPFQSNGIGKRLLERIIDEAKQLNDLSQLQLVVISENTSAIKLYQKYGFETFAFERDALRLGQKSYDAKHMVLFL
ncbi:GNAT family N-acetyltransferase [Zooshikella marina]|uniref:GNAT family N-acetyltransferase n=1 Tax=Zooshikella ganghwensis TaxID=202772 RepID=UPI001BAEF39C|nr:GNAT family N-acetyltransferase [Zooshikella ganghwensis]MBU2705049.1 GNAT family N-acetyltransferase [Zooshikella ganghwensis]